MRHPHETDYTRMGIAVFAAALLLIFWQAKIEWPRRQQLEMQHAEHAKSVALEKEREAQARAQAAAKEGEVAPKTHEQRIAASPRVSIAADKLHGSIALKGARFDDLMLARYHMELDPSSPEVRLFAPAGDEQAYFATAGWVATDGKTKVPDSTSLWQADKQVLKANDTVNLRWNNGAGVVYVLSISLDQDYMFSIAQRVENKSGADIVVTPYAYINRTYDEPSQHFAIMHEGPMGVADGKLDETSYSDLREAGTKKLDNAEGWVGITDKYWLAALVPAPGTYKATLSYYTKADAHRYQVDFLGNSQTVAAGNVATSDLRLFAGAKEIEVLDNYAAGGNGKAPIPLFDRAVDFGVLYFLTKPLFLMLNFFYSHLGNFGLAIMMLTIVVKLAMFPLANKAFRATTQMRDLQPEMERIKERCGEDKQKYGQEVMAMYKREKVNPASGCLPVLIQMPVFFALYKVFFVTIEMRHAPFFGWLRDLSAPDSSNLFTLFTLVPWNHPSWLHLGILPMLMCLTMVIQMKQQPKPTDPVQAKMMNLMPYFFLFMFTGFPAGLVLYWVWSNTLSIFQQMFITWHYHRTHPVGIQKKQAKKAAKKEAAGATS